MAVYHRTSADDIPHIQRLMNHHDHFKTMPDFYGTKLNDQTIEKMRLGAYLPDIGNIQ